VSIRTSETEYPDPRDLRLVMDARPLSGGFTAIGPGGSTRVPLVFLKIDSLARGKDFEAAARHDGPPDDSFKFVLVTPEIARELADALKEAADRAEAEV